MLTATPLWMAPTPWSMLPLPLAKTAVRVAEAPTATVVGLAVKLVIAGAAGATVMAPPPPPQASWPISAAAARRIGSNRSRDMGLSSSNRRKYNCFTDSGY